MSQRGRAVGNTVSDLTARDLNLEPPAPEMNASSIWWSSSSLTFHCHPWNEIALLDVLVNLDVQGVSQKLSTLGPTYCKLWASWSVHGDQGERLSNEDLAQPTSFGGAVKAGDQKLLRAIQDQKFSKTNEDLNLESSPRPSTLFSSPPVQLPPVSQVKPCPGTWSCLV